jgi:CAAX protease family protein
MHHQSDENYSDLQDIETYISPLTILLFLALLMMFGILLGSGTTYLLGKYFGYSLKETMDYLSPESGIEKRNFIRFTLLANHIVLFIVPPVILAILFFKRKWYKFLGWKKLGLEQLIINGLVGSFLILVSMPFVQYIYYWNKQLPLPQWAKTIDDSTNEAIKNLLHTDASWELFFNIFVIAIVPAIGEEMVFRGVVQQRLEKWIGKPDFAIWIAAAIFSGFHMQLEGFFPRLFLGALLGYLFYWTRSLWIPIIVHFVNNALQIVAMHFFEKDISTIDIEKIDQVPIWGALISILLILVISRFLINFNSLAKKQNKEITL